MLQLIDRYALFGLGLGLSKPSSASCSVVWASLRDSSLSTNMLILIYTPGACSFIFCALDGIVRSDWLTLYGMTWRAMGEEKAGKVFLLARRNSWWPCLREFLTAKHAFAVRAMTGGVIAWKSRTLTLSIRVRPIKSEYTPHCTS